MAESQNSRTGKWITKAKQHPVIVILLAVSAILTFIITTAGQIDHIYRWYAESFSYTAVYEKLAQMRVGLSSATVTELFGVPISERNICESGVVDCPERWNVRYRVSTYENRAFHLRVIYSGEQVVFYSVTSRKEDFRPEIVTIFSDDHKRLGDATFADIVPAAYGPDRVDMFLGTSRVAYWEIKETGRPGNYQTYYLGHSSAGYSYEFAVDQAAELAGAIEGHTVDDSRRSILQAFREHSQPNTYGFFDDSSKTVLSRDFSELMNSDDMFLWRALPLYEGADPLF